MFLIAANVRIVTESGWFYTYAFDRYEVSERTGIEPRELRRVADEIKAYFRSGEERLDVRATVYGDERDLFSEREILHMIDVKRLMRGVSLIERVSFYTMAGLALALLALVGRRAALLTVGTRARLWGGAELRHSHRAGDRVSRRLRRAFHPVPRHQLRQRPVAARP